MSHFQSFTAHSYRGLDGLSLDRLRQVNLITGRNGVGKTALLEALWLFHGRFRPNNLWNQHLQRSVRPSVNPLSALAAAEVSLAGREDDEPRSCRFAFESPVSTVGGDRNGGASDNGAAQRPKVPRGSGQAVPVRVVGHLQVWLDDREVATAATPVGGPNGVVLVPMPSPVPKRPAGVIDLPVPTFDPSQDNINRYSGIVRRGEKEDLKRGLRLVLPVVQELEIVTSDDGSPYILATTDAGERMPLQALGGGMMRLFRLFTGFHATRGGILLIDEIEDGLHHSILGRLWRDIRRMATDFDVQVFATTHSLECLRAAMECFADHAEEFAVHGLYRPPRERGARAVTYADEQLRAAAEVNMDLR